MAAEKLLTRSVVSKVPIAATVTLDMPPSANELFSSGRGRRFRSPKYETWSQAAGWSIRRARLPFFDGRVAIEMRAGKPKRVRDLDNLIKPIFDALVDFRVIADDHLVRSLIAEWDEATVEPGTVRIRVRALGISA